MGARGKNIENTGMKITRPGYVTILTLGNCCDM